jgi:hypothetical protein
MLKEGKSIFKVRPKCENGTWGDPYSFVIFVDTKAPVVTNPVCDPVLGASTFTIGAASIADDISVTSDVSKLSYVKFDVTKDHTTELSYSYTNIDQIVSPITSHTFSLDIDNDSIFEWSITVRDNAGNQTIVQGVNFFRSIDGQVRIAGALDNVFYFDGRVVIGHIGSHLGLIPVEPIVDTGQVITTDEYIQVINTITTENVINTNLITLDELEESDSVITGDQIEGKDIILVNPPDEEHVVALEESNSVETIEPLEEKDDIIQLEELEGSDQVITTGDVGET